MEQKFYPIGIKVDPDGFIILNNNAVDRIEDKDVEIFVFDSVVFASVVIDSVVIDSVVFDAPVFDLFFFLTIIVDIHALNYFSLSKNFKYYLFSLKLFILSSSYTFYK